jgi:hypothetical protein
VGLRHEYFEFLLTHTPGLQPPAQTPLPCFSEQLLSKLSLLLPNLLPLPLASVNENPLRHTVRSAHGSRGTSMATSPAASEITVVAETHAYVRGCPARLGLVFRMPEMLGAPAREPSPRPPSPTAAVCSGDSCRRGSLLRLRGVTGSCHHSECSSRRTSARRRPENTVRYTVPKDPVGIWGCGLNDLVELT